MSIMKKAKLTSNGAERTQQINHIQQNGVSAYPTLINVIYTSSTFQVMVLAR